MNESIIKLAVDIKKSGLHKKNKIAQQLLNEVVLMLKESRSNKTASLNMIGQGQSASFKQYFQYWCLSALSKLKELGHPELSSVEVNAPTSSDQNQSVESLVSKYLSGRGGRRRPSFMRDKALSTNTVENIIEIAWKSWGQSSMTEKSNQTVAVTKSYYGKTDTRGVMIQGDPQDSISVIDSVIFVWNGHLIKTQDAPDGTRLPTGYKSVWETIYKRTKIKGDLQNSIKQGIEGGVWSRAMNTITWTYQQTNVEQAAPGEAFDDGRSEEWERGVGGGIDPLALEVYSLYAQDQEDDVEGEIEDYVSSYIEDNATPVESIPGFKDLNDEDQESMREEHQEMISKAVLVQLNALKERVQSIEGSFDAVKDLILPGSWLKVVKNFDSGAMDLLDHTITTNGAKLLPYAIKSLIDINDDAQKLETFSKFIDKCMSDVGVLTKKLGNKASTNLWIYYIMASVGITINAQRVKDTFKTSFDGNPKASGFTQLMKAIKLLSEAERDVLSKDIAKLMSKYAPVGVMGTYASAKSVRENFVDILFTAEKAGSSSMRNILGGGAAKARSQGGIWSIVASELIRYRYYMDLNMEDSDQSDVPNSIKDPECAKLVKILIPRLPADMINSVKQEVLEEAVVPEVVESLEEKINSAIQKGKTGVIDLGNLF